MDIILRSHVFAMGGHFLQDSKQRILRCWMHASLDFWSNRKSDRRMGLGGGLFGKGRLGVPLWPVRGVVIFA